MLYAFALNGERAPVPQLSAAVELVSVRPMVGLGRSKASSFVAGERAGPEGAGMSSSWVSSNIDPMV